MAGPAPLDAKARSLQRIGGYEILLPVARGGMAMVYLGRPRRGGTVTRDVAIKVPHAKLADSGGFRADFLEEARLAMQIDHPNVVATLEVGEDRGGPFLVMDYVEGSSLGGLAKVAGKPLPHRIGIALLLDALAGLHAAHELRGPRGAPLNLVHRDFSPHNVLVGLDGVGRLTDFGIAKAASRLGSTRSGVVKGKLPYMAPEQARDRPLDRRTDVWAAGVVVWEMVTGKRLYRDDGVVQYLSRLVSEPPPRARELATEVSVELDEVVARALRLEPDERYPTAADFAAALRGAMSSSTALAAADERAAHVQRWVGDSLRQRRAAAERAWQLRQPAEAAAAPAQASGEPKPHGDAIAPEVEPTLTMPTRVTRRRDSGRGQ